MPRIRTKVIRVRDPKTGIWHDLPGVISLESLRAAERARASELAAEEAQSAAEDAQGASEAAQSAAEAAQSAAEAAQSAAEAAQSGAEDARDAASDSASAAAGSAASAAAELAAVEAAGTAAVGAVQSAQATAVAAVEEAAEEIAGSVEQIQENADGIEALKESVDALAVITNDDTHGWVIGGLNSTMTSVTTNTARARIKGADINAIGTADLISVVVPYPYEAMIGIYSKSDDLSSIVKILTDSYDDGRGEILIPAEYYGKYMSMVIRHIGNDTQDFTAEEIETLGGLIQIVRKNGFRTLDAELDALTESVTNAALLTLAETSNPLGSVGKGKWAISDDTVSFVSASSGYNFALNPVAVEPGDIVHISFYPAAGASIIFAHFEDDAYTVVSSESPGQGNNPDRNYVIENNVTHVLLTKYGSALTPYCNKITQKTDKTLTKENVAADAKAVSDAVNAANDEIMEISEGKRNLLYATNTRDRTLSNGVSAVFMSPTRISLENPSGNSGATRILLNGNTAYNDGTFRRNIQAGSYYIYWDNGGISSARVYLCYRYSDMENHYPSSGEVTLTEDAEMFIVTSSNAAFSGTIRFMLSTDECEYEDYGYLSANDKAARGDIEEIYQDIDELSQRIVSSDEVSAFYRNPADFTNHGFYPYKYHPSEFNSEFITDIPLHPGYPTGNSATSGMCGDGVRYLWITVRSGESNPCAIFKYDLMTGQFVQQRYDTVLGHAQSMCYKKGEIYVLSYISGDSSYYADGGTIDRITVLDADTLAVKRHFGTEPLFRSTQHSKRLQAIGWSDTFNCLVGVTPAATESNPVRAVVLFTEDGILREGDITNYEAVCDGIAIDNSYISPMITYRLAYITWDALSVIGYNNAHKILEEQETIIGSVLESESVVSFPDGYYVNANVMGASQSAAGAMKLFKAVPKRHKFIT